MPKVRAGATPWSNDTDFFGDHHRKTQKGLHKEDIHWTLRGGYRRGTGPFTDHILYDERPTSQWETKPKHYKTKTVTIPSTGKKVQVPDGLDLDYYFGQGIEGNRTYSGGRRLDKSSATDQEIGEFIDGATWNDKYTIGGQSLGHISQLRYAPSKQLMEVTFTNNGSVVVYFSVPVKLYAFLHNLAERGSGSVDKHGVLRHDLGKEFWNAVRIRGTVHGYRYEFTYTNMGESTSQGIGDSRTVVAKVNKRMGALSNMVPDELADLADTAKRMMKKFPKVDTSGMSNEQLIAKAMELGML